MIGLDPFTWICPNGLNSDHQIITPDETYIPDYIKCERCGLIYPTKRATHYHREFGWCITAKELVYTKEDLYDTNRHLCRNCTPKGLIRWDYVRKKIMGNGR